MAASLADSLPTSEQAGNPIRQCVETSATHIQRFQLSVCREFQSRWKDANRLAMASSFPTPLLHLGDKEDVTF